MISNSQKKILLTGATGNLGVALGTFLKKKYFVHQPLRKTLDITNQRQVNAWVQSHSFDSVVHTAALARMKTCEENPSLAIETNVIGTANLVYAILQKEKETQKEIRFIHISTDGVYDGQKGNFSERCETLPYNVYGWSKLGSECAVRALKNHCIIRGSFFDPQNLIFPTAATDVFSSRIPLDEFVKAIEFLIENTVCGVLNVGGERKSDYERYLMYKKEIRPCTQEDILKDSGVPMAKDASLNCSKWQKLRGEF
ncbi:MAG: hypothetical protein A3B70_02445 [Deltaproteobacteria bacterium RIFCSPHIGHO2_02_FULL_40_11]|nr:MAG: hypothetical protein A3B70_02445 [Deltaproteobacteria bacterium RIFCSPHIGHO2_02_FULL_40_11]